MSWFEFCVVQLLNSRTVGKYIKLIAFL